MLSRHVHDDVRCTIIRRFDAVEPDLQMQSCKVASELTSCRFDVVDRFRHSYDSNESIGNASDNVYKRGMDPDVSFGVSLSVNSPVVYNASLRHRRRGVVVRYFTNRPRRVLDGSRGVGKKKEEKRRERRAKRVILARRVVDCDIRAF